MTAAFQYECVLCIYMQSLIWKSNKYQYSIEKEKVSCVDLHAIE